MKKSIMKSKKMYMCPSFLVMLGVLRIAIPIGLCFSGIITTDHAMVLDYFEMLDTPIPPRKKEEGNNLAVHEK